MTDRHHNDCALFAYEQGSPLPYLSGHEAPCRDKDGKPLNRCERPTTKLRDSSETDFTAKLAHPMIAGLVFFSLFLAIPLASLITVKHAAKPIPTLDGYPDEHLGV